MNLGIPKGTRDFSPVEVERRNYIFDTIRTVFRKFGYQPIETPVMENLSTLTGKYGDEGDQLIFKVLNSGDFLSKTKLFDADNQLSHYKKITPQISEKALRYDLTVPFARYVVMHRNDIAMPFKRFQIQPVWRADRPQKGRYREFYQCDADVVGSDSLLNESEFIMMYDEALSNLGLKDFSIKINNRKILSGIAELIGKPELIIDMTVAIDKLDKIGLDGVIKELLERGFTENDIETLKPFINLSGSNEEKLQNLQQSFASSEIGKKGIAELREILFNLEYSENNIIKSVLKNAKVEVDITLARGLNYYTGAIFEVKSNEVAMGSIGGGGRYDDLTGMFGLKGITGVGISFGADRIYDVMQDLNLFSTKSTSSTIALIANFDGIDLRSVIMPLILKLRNNNINTEYYPSSAKLQKQLKYANDKNIPFVVFINNEGVLELKDMITGEQSIINIEELINKLKNN